MNSIFNYLKESGKIIFLSMLLMSGTGLTAFSGISYTDKDSSLSIKGKKAIFLQEQLQLFYPLNDSAEYTITICADLPDNNNPQCVYKKGEPGHVFIILAKRNLLTEEIITSSFGFYPRVAVTFLVKQVRSRILENNNREYNASIEKKLTKEEFELMLDKCIEFAKKKYNLKKYNCYDYVLEVFNSLPGIEKLPVSRVKFPFIFGKGGSPCGLYKDLKNLQSANSAWAPFIRIGTFTSPHRIPGNSFASN